MGPSRTPPTEGDHVLGGSLGSRPVMSHSTPLLPLSQAGVTHVPSGCGPCDMETITVGSSVPQGSECFLLHQPLCSFLAGRVHVFPGAEEQKNIQESPSGLQPAAGGPRVWPSGCIFLPRGLAFRSVCGHSLRDAQTYLVPALSFDRGSCVSSTTFRGRRLKLTHRQSG